MKILELSLIEFSSTEVWEMRGVAISETSLDVTAEAKGKDPINRSSFQLSVASPNANVPPLLAEAAILSVLSLHKEYVAPVSTNSKAKPKLMASFMRKPEITRPL